MGNIDQSDLQFPDAGNDGNHDAQQDELTSFDSSTLLFPSVGDADEPQHTAPAQPPQPPAKARRSAKAAKPTAKSAQPAQPERTTDGDGFDLPVWGAGDATSNADEPTQLFTPAEAAQRATTAMPAIDSTTVERTQLIAQDRPARTVVNDVNETHTALPEPKGPASFAPMGGDGDGGSTDHEDPDNGGNGKRKKIIIGVVSAVVVVALAAGGVVLWQRNRSAQENRSHDAAVESCERAHTALQTAYTELDKQISKTKPLAQTKDSAVADAATLQAFQKSSKAADELQQKKDEAVVACNTADSREKLEQNAQSMDEQIDGVESATKQLKSDADALTASRDAKSTKSLKDDLTKAIADAQTTYDESANAVADEQTRTALQQAIGGPDGRRQAVARQGRGRCGQGEADQRGERGGRIRKRAGRSERRRRAGGPAPTAAAAGAGPAAGASGAAGPPAATAGIAAATAGPTATAGSATAAAARGQ